MCGSSDASARSPRHWPLHDSTYRFSCRQPRAASHGGRCRTRVAPHRFSRPARPRRSRGTAAAGLQRASRNRASRPRPASRPHLRHGSGQPRHARLPSAPGSVAPFRQHAAYRKSTLSALPAAVSRAMRVRSRRSRAGRSAVLPHHARPRPPRLPAHAWRQASRTVAFRYVPAARRRHSPPRGVTDPSTGAIMQPNRPEEGGTRCPKKHRSRSPSRSSPSSSR